jgi:phage terminase large subunit
MSNVLFPKTTQLVAINLEAKEKTIVHQGGSSSGKTWSIIQSLFLLAIQDAGSVITVVGQDIPNLRKGSYRDAQNLIGATPGLKPYIADHNKSERIFTFKNGSVIEFNSYSDSQDAKNGKRDYLFVNEANGITYNIFAELYMRTSKKTYIDFNPTAEFWAHEKLKKAGVLWVKSTFKHNPFIDPSIKEKILGYKETDPYRWQVYGLGEVGKIEGLVFDNFEETAEWPEEYKWRKYGLDFGFTNDPTCLIEMRLAHGELFIKQHIYEAGLTNQDIVEKMATLEINVDSTIVADSAEPKSIEEIRRLGFPRIVPAVKGQDSIEFGISKLKEYKINIYKSPDVIAEFSSYTWKKDKTSSKHTRIPIDKFNHAIDPARYIITHDEGFTGFY